MCLTGQRAGQCQARACAGLSKMSYSGRKMPDTSVELPVGRGPEFAGLGIADQLPILEKHLRAWLESPSEVALEGN